MYAAIRRYEGVTESREAARLVLEGFLPIISQVPGFVAYYFVDAGGGVMISTNVFAEQASAEDLADARPTSSGSRWPPCSRTRPRSPWGSGRAPDAVSRTGTVTPTRTTTRPSVPTRQPTPSQQQNEPARSMARSRESTSRPGAREF